VNAKLIHQYISFFTSSLVYDVPGCDGLQYKKPYHIYVENFPPNTRVNMELVKVDVSFWEGVWMMMRADE